MAECVQILKDLQLMADQLDIGILKHHFKTYSPSNSKALSECLSHFYMPDIEASDFRSAYQQFSDWLYGWNVSNATDLLDTRNNPAEYLTLIRKPREININVEKERQDCERLMKCFATLCSISRRKLKNLYNDIADQIPEVGKGLHNALNSGEQYENEAFSEEAELLWGQDNDAKAPLTSMHDLRTPEIPSASGESKNIVPEKVTAESSETRGSFSFLKFETSDKSLIDAKSRRVKEDILFLLGLIDACAEYTLLSVCSVTAILGFAELIKDDAAYKKICSSAHELSMDFVSNTFRMCWDLLGQYVGAELHFSQVRDLSKLGLLLQKISEEGFCSTDLRFTYLHAKFGVIHDIFRILDINLFPNFISAHSEALKCASYSAFDSNLWLTAGYDCIIRISDIRETNLHICLAQYVGHKSIVTDAHFARNDECIVSCSFDRTIRIWNAQTAVVDRTLLGHNDAILTCHVSPDGKYVASGSMDNTARLWDFSSGECLAITKKHTKWVKVVRFSPDGKYLATAGMDNRVFIWDVKMLANTKSPSHSRCFDNFVDYVLDISMTKPSLMLTASRDSKIRLFDYITGHQLYEVDLSPSWASSISFSEDGECFATGSCDNNINIFRTKDFVKLREIRAFNMGIKCVKFPKDVCYVVIGTEEGFLQQIML